MHIEPGVRPNNYEYEENDEPERATYFAVATDIWENDYSQKVTWEEFMRNWQNLHVCSTLPDYFGLLKKETNKEFNRLWKFGWSLRARNRSAYIRTIIRGAQNPLFIVYVRENEKYEKHLEHELRHFFDYLTGDVKPPSQSYEFWVNGIEISDLMMRASLGGFVSLSLLSFFRYGLQLPDSTSTTIMSFIGTTFFSLIFREISKHAYLNSPQEQSVRSRMRD